MCRLRRTLAGKADVPACQPLKAITPPGPQQVEEKLKELGWLGDSPVASMAIYFENGAISDSQIFILGPREVGRISAPTLFGDTFHKDSYAKIGNMDPALASVRGRMVFDWIPDTDMDWQLKIINHETGRFKVINKIDVEGLKDVGANSPSIRLHLFLDKGPKLSARLAQVPGEKDRPRDIFKILHVEKALKLEVVPEEPREADFGLGFVPLFIHTGEEDPVYPDFGEVRDAIRDHFNTACKPKAHKKPSTWKSSMALDSWEKLDFLWPPRTETSTTRPEDGEEGKKLSKLSCSEFNISCPISLLCPLTNFKIQSYGKLYFSFVLVSKYLIMSFKMSKPTQQLKWLPYLRKHPYC